MSVDIELPEILDIPEKLLPIITEFNDYRYFLLHGGRGGAKSNSAGRFLLFLGEQKKLRISCGRETQNSIQESVYALLSDIIRKYELNYEVTATKITHRVTGTVFTFRGFREQGAVNVQGMEGVDIVWIDEAQAVTKITLDALIPTIRKDNAKLFFTMNRHLRNDPVFSFLSGRKDCLIIHINYYDNKHCTQALKNEAEECKARNMDDYRHIWLGEPLESAENVLIKFSMIENLKGIFHNPVEIKRVVSCDPSLGGDECVIKALENGKILETKILHENNTMVIVGEIAVVMNRHGIDDVAVDVIGIGAGVADRLSEIGKNVIRINSAEQAEEKDRFVNKRAEMWWYAMEQIQKREIPYPEDEELRRQLSAPKYQVVSSSGKIKLEPKEETKKILGRSPDRADAYVYGLWALKSVSENDIASSIKFGRKEKPCFSGAAGY